MSKTGHWICGLEIIVSTFFNYNHQVIKKIGIGKFHVGMNSAFPALLPSSRLCLLCHVVDHALQVTLPLDNDHALTQTYLLGWDGERTVILLHLDQGGRRVAGGKADNHGAQRHGKGRQHLKHKVMMWLTINLTLLISYVIKLLHAC